MPKKEGQALSAGVNWEGQASAAREDCKFDADEGSEAVGSWHCPGLWPFCWQRVSHSNQDGLKVKVLPASLVYSASTLHVDALLAAVAVRRLEGDGKCPRCQIQPQLACSKLRMLQSAKRTQPKSRSCQAGLDNCQLPHT